ncbi:hypothetical protein AAVH_14280 [Aphelenchoides avenae]|nr:hypothetical protein AAVH_14280 [Aphelenchus avenae]
MDHRVDEHSGYSSYGQRDFAEANAVDANLEQEMPTQEHLEKKTVENESSDATTAKTGTSDCSEKSDMDDVISKLRLYPQLTSDLKWLLDTFGENLRMAHVNPHQGSKDATPYEDIADYVKNSTTLVMADRYAAKEDWNSMNIDNFDSFSSTLVSERRCPNLERIVVLTPNANIDTKGTKWTELTKRLSERNVSVEHIDFDLHPRKIWSSDGLTLESDRGIHIGNSKETHNRSRASTLIFYRTRADDPIPPPVRKWVLPSPPPPPLQAETTSSTTKAFSPHPPQTSRFAETSANATPGPQASNASQPTNTVSYARIASANGSQNAIVRVIPPSSFASKLATHSSSGGTASSMTHRIDNADEGGEYNPPKTEEQCRYGQGSDSLPGKSAKKPKRLYTCAEDAKMMEAMFSAAKDDLVQSSLRRRICGRV